MTRIKTPKTIIQDEKSNAKKELAKLWGSNIWEGDLEKMRLEKNF